MPRNFGGNFFVSQSVDASENEGFEFRGVVKFAYLAKAVLCAVGKTSQVGRAFTASLSPH